MIQYVNGQPVDVSIDGDGGIDSDALRDVARVPKDRALIQQLSNGENHIINPGERIKFYPNAHYRDVANHIRG